MLIDVAVGLLAASQALGQRKGFEDRARVVAAAAKVVNLPGARRIGKLGNEARHVECMDVVANLLALVAEHRVRLSFDVALNQVREEAVQLHAGMMRARQATTS